MPTPTREEVAEVFTKGAERNFAEYGEVAPLFALIKVGKPPMLFTPDFSSEQMKDHMVTVVRNAAAVLRPDYIVFVAEAWRAEVPLHTEPVRASEAPNRVECVQVIVAQPNSMLTFLADIHRPDAGPATLREWVRAEGDAVGRFADLFPHTHLH